MSHMQAVERPKSRWEFQLMGVDRVAAGIRIAHSLCDSADVQGRRAAAESHPFTEIQEIMAAQSRH